MAGRVESVAEQTAAYAYAVASGEMSGDEVLRWHPVGVCDDRADEDQLRAGLRALYADSPWIDISRIVAEVYDGGTHPADARRYYLNQPASADDAWIRADQRHALRLPMLVEDGETITLGFDGSRGRTRCNADATALVGCTVKGGHLFELGVWQPARVTASGSHPSG